jgi:hypothetical protein
MAIAFPSGPNLGDRWPLDPGTAGTSQWEWDGAKWVVVPSFVSIGLTNQDAYNSYNWPLNDGPPGYQLQTDGAGNLSWQLEADANIQALGLFEVIDGTSQTYTLVELGTNVFFTPTPATNIVVFLGGVPQIPTSAYSISGSQITFVDPPPAGSTFYAISNVVVSP